MPTSSTRQDVEIRSGDDAVAAWFYPASTDAERAPCVVMSHGFSLTRHDGLAPYAEAFAAAGTHALVFDPRYLGDSGGHPRQRFRIGAQQQDWQAVVEHVRARPEVDTDRVGAWAFSFGAGIVASLLVRGRLDVCAAMLLCPFVDGLRRTTQTPLPDLLRVVPYAARDLLGRGVTVPVTAEPGHLGAMTFPGEAAGFAGSVPPGSPWRNAISPGVLLSVWRFRPVRRADRIEVPLWVGRCADDITVDAAAVERTAAGAPRGELQDFTGDHFAPFTGEVTSKVIEAQLGFWIGRSETCQSQLWTGSLVCIRSRYSSRVARSASYRSWSSRSSIRSTNHSAPLVPLRQRSSMIPSSRSLLSPSAPHDSSPCRAAGSSRRSTSSVTGT